jgi:SAM-dependent methyltransferase
MDDWSEGYRTDIGYTHGYYPELNPLRARLALLTQGIACPAFRTACELGFGQGVSVNVHGAATATAWYGTDFNPSHADFARVLAGDTQLADRLFDEAFAEFCQRPGLPDFDFIGLHGIWSWVSEANRAVIADFILRKLKVGGVLYISYNTQPGWAPIVPLRDLLNSAAGSMVAPGTDTSKRIETALDFAERILATDARFAQANPAAAAHLKNLRGQNRHYVAHEYFNRDWAPMPFSRMADTMASLKLQFAGAAGFLDHVPNLNLTQPQQQLLAEIPDTTLRETTRDFLVNQMFRRDYWVRGLRRLSVLERVERLRAERVVLGKPAAQVPLSVNTPLGQGDLNKDIYMPVLEALGDHRPRTIGEIEAVVGPRGVPLSLVVEALLVLTGIGVVHAAQDEQAIAAAAPAARRLNAAILDHARHSEAIACLASPVTGGGITIGRIEQMFLLARSQGTAAPGEWVRYADGLLRAQGQRLIVAGKILETPEAQLQYLDEEAARFQQALPIYQAFGIAD